jgi:hypothetical protein
MWIGWIFYLGITISICFVKSRKYFLWILGILVAILLCNVGGCRAIYNMRLLQNPLWGVCKREVRIQNTGVRITEHVARERVPILNSEFWLLNTALAEPTKEVLQAPQSQRRVLTDHATGD